MMGIMRWKKMAWVAVGVAVLAFVVRLPGLSDFMTADEENWMLRSAAFWHKLGRQADAGGTFMTTHPGAPAMWIIGAGVVWQEARAGFDIDTSNLRHFRLAATLPVAAVTAVLTGVAAWLLLRLFGAWPGVMAALVLALDPYLVGMSQIAHLDALLALFMLLAVLLFMHWLKRGGRRWLLATGALAGLALATKFLPALWLFVFFTVLTAAAWRRGRVTFSGAVRVLGFTAGVAALTAYALWPALWVKDDWWHSFERDAAVVATDEHVALSEGEEPIEPMSYYLRTVLGRATPFVLVLALGTVVVAIRFFRLRRQMLATGWLLLYAAGFLVLMTVAAKKADRYALPALAALAVVAGWAFGMAIEILKERRPARGLALPFCAAAAVCALLIGQVLLWSPYAIAYNSPFFDVRPTSQQGWGEGLEAAARWLNAHPLAEKLTVASWYRGVLSTYFNGTTMSLSSRDDHRVGFVVTYRNMAGRARDTIASDVLDEFRGLQPEHTVFIQGVPYAFVYNTLGPRYFRQHAGELVGGVEVGQLVPVNVENWSRIDLGLATFSSRQNTEDIVLHVREDINATEDLRTVIVNAREVADEAWQRFEFEPIKDSAGRAFYVALTSPGSVPGNAVTVRFVLDDVLPGQMVLRRRALRDGELNSDFVRAGDLAYRIPSQP